MIDINRVKERLNNVLAFMEVESAVSDIPQQVKDAANKHWYNGFRGFVKSLYNMTRMDLNSLTPEVKTFKRLSQPEIDKATKDGSTLVIVFKYRSQEGIITLTDTSTDLYIKGRETEGVELDSGYYRILGRPRNVVVFINKPGVEYTAWQFSFPSGSTMDKRNQRSEQKKGAIFRTPEALRDWAFTYDKSGYKIDKNKYQKLLQEIRKNSGMWSKKTNTIMNEFLYLQTKIAEAKKIDNLRYRLSDTMEAVSKAFLRSLESYYSDKEKNEAFESAQRELDKLKNYMKNEGIQF